LTISLFCACVRLKSDAVGKAFELVTVDQIHKFGTESEKETLQWTATLEDICVNLIHNSIGSDPTKMKQVAGKSAQNIPTITTSGDLSPLRKDLNNVMNFSGNQVCADCGTRDNEWTSVNLGIFVCIQCSGAHRNLGSHISKVRSCLYDRIEPAKVKFLESMGNLKANSFWECQVPQEVKKPSPTDKIEVKQEFIKSKYCEMAFIDLQKKDEILQLFGIQVKKAEAPAIIEVTGPGNETPNVKQQNSTSSSLFRRAASRRTMGFGHISGVPKSKSQETVSINPLFGKDVNVKDHFKKVMDELSEKKGEPDQEPAATNAPARQEKQTSEKEIRRSHSNLG